MLLGTASNRPKFVSGRFAASNSAKFPGPQHPNGHNILSGFCRLQPAGGTLSGGQNAPRDQVLAPELKLAIA
jgi:hypothetical protein